MQDEELPPPVPEDDKKPGLDSFRSVNKESLCFRSFLGLKLKYLACVKTAGQLGFLIDQSVSHTLPSLIRDGILPVYVHLLHSAALKSFNLPASTY